jgi:hypothetical protein
MSAIGVVILAAILGGVIQATIAMLDRNREARAAALVVGDALTEALLQNHAPQMHPGRPVIVDYSAYAAVWETERKVLARVMARDDYNTVSKAFGRLRVIAKKETVGLDLRDEVFDALYEAGQACEFGRRVTHRYAQSGTEKHKLWLAERLVNVRKQREYRKLDRMWREARKAEARNASK